MSAAAQQPASSSRRVLLLGVAALLTGAAALAIGILLFGDFGSTEGRILGSTAALAAYGLLSLPAAMLFDRRRLVPLAAAVSVLAVAGATLLLVLIWSGEPSETFGKTIGTVNVWLAAGVQTAALSLRRQGRDTLLVRRLFVASTVLVVLLAVLFSAMLWSEPDSIAVGRVLGSLVVLDVLLVALQPLLARARPLELVHRIVVVCTDGTSVALEVEAPDLATAAARAVRGVAPRTVSRLEFPAEADAAAGRAG